LDGEVAMAKETIDKVLYLDPMHGNKKKEVWVDVNIELHAPTSSTQKLKLMRKGGQFSYTPTHPLTFRLPQAAYVEIGVGL
jgi:hypothetical protein